METFTSLSLGSLRFLDSLNFLNSSLQQLTKNLLTEGDSKFALVKHFFPEKKQHSLLLRKGVYPYSYMDSMARFEETCLPSREEFFSHLTLEHISKEDYQHAHNVFAEFNMKNLGDYHDCKYISQYFCFSASYAMAF